MIYFWGGTTKTKEVSLKRKREGSWLVGVGIVIVAMLMALLFAKPF
jgi:hypothetical protein